MSRTYYVTAYGESGMKRLIIVSASLRRLEEPSNPIPALDRFDGVYFRIIKKYKREGKLQDTDCVIVSKKFGIIDQNERVPYYKPDHIDKFGYLNMNESQIKKLREENLARLKEIFAKSKYSEIFVNVGKHFMELIKGFEKLTSAKIIYASGRGLGPKAQHMKKWILYGK